MAETAKILWERCMEFFRNNMNEQQYQTWFVPIRFKSYNEKDSKVVISIPSQFFYEFLEEHYRPILHKALYRYYGTGTKLMYEVEVVKQGRVRQASSDTPLIEQDKKRKEVAAPIKGPGLQELDSQLNPNQNFDNFIEGNSNKLPRSIGKTIAEHPDQKTFNPLFIFGPSGVGKTHLVNAIGTRMKELYPQKRVLYLSAHLFQVQYTDSIRRNTFNDFMYFYQSIDVLIMDDIQEIAGKAQTQLAFFHIFNHLHQNGKQIILTSDRPPVSLLGMEDRLLTRFKWGLMAELEKPEVDLRRHILKHKIQQEGLKIPNEVIDYISENINGSARELEGVINSLLAYSIVFNKDVDLDFAKKIIKNNTRIEKKDITIDQIVDDTCDCCNVKQEDIFGKSRKANIVEARQLSIYLAQKHIKMTHSKIGALIGNRDHATVIHSIKTIENRLQHDKELQTTLKRIEDKLNSRR